MVMASSNHGMCSGRTRIGKASPRRKLLRRSMLERVCVAIGLRVRRYFKVQTYGCTSSIARSLRGDMQRIILGARSMSAVVRFHSPNDFRQNLRLAVSLGMVVRKRHPKWHAGIMGFLARYQQTATRHIQCFANLHFLSEGGRPAKSDGKAELRAVVLTSVHNPWITSGLGGTPKVYAAIPRVPRPRTRT